MTTIINITITITITITIYTISTSITSILPVLPLPPPQQYLRVQILGAAGNTRLNVTSRSDNPITEYVMNVKRMKSILLFKEEAWSLYT